LQMRQIADQTKEGNLSHMALETLNERLNNLAEKVSARIKIVQDKLRKFPIRIKIKIRYGGT